MMVTVKRILKAIGNKNLTLWRCDDYYVFEYDAAETTGFFDTETVMVPRLNCASIYWWVRTGQTFLKKCLDKEAEMIENRDNLNGRFRFK